MRQAAFISSAMRTRQEQLLRQYECSTHGLPIITPSSSPLEDTFAFFCAAPIPFECREAGVHVRSTAALRVLTRCGWKYAASLP